MYLIIATIVIISLFFVFLFLNTLKYRKKRSCYIEPLPYELSEETANKFKDAISIKTVSHTIYDKNELKYFKAFIDFIKNSYPLVHKELETTTLNDYSCFIKWPGKEKSEKAVLLMAHYDVVPVSDKNWSVDPFGGVEKDGYIWGRGTLDTKHTLTAILESSEQLLQQGFTPRRTIYMAFGGDEETLGSEGAGTMSRYFYDHDIEFEWLLDEGGVVAKDSFSMVKNPLALVGISEKGFVNLTLKSEGVSGHSSMPPEHTAAGHIARAVTVIENNPFKTKITPTMHSFLKGIIPYVSFPIAIIMANQKLFAPLIKTLLLKSPSSAALIRTTQAVTILKSGEKENVLPSSGEAVVNFRILPGETAESVLRRTKKLLMKKNVQVSISKGEKFNNPIEESSMTGEGYNLIDRVIKGIYPDSVTIPFMMTGGTDSKHYRHVCSNLYRFAPLSLSNDEISLIHSADERISVENYRKIIQFYLTLIKNI